MPDIMFSSLTLMPLSPSFFHSNLLYHLGTLFFLFKFTSFLSAYFSVHLDGFALKMSGTSLLIYLLFQVFLMWSFGESQNCPYLFFFFFNIYLKSAPGVTVYFEDCIFIVTWCYMHNMCVFVLMLFFSDFFFIINSFKVFTFNTFTYL